MIIKTIEIGKFRSFESVSFDLGRRITAISGRNATQKTTVLGMIGQPFYYIQRTYVRLQNNRRIQFSLTV